MSRVGNWRVIGAVLAVASLGTGLWWQRQTTLCGDALERRRNAELAMSSGTASARNMAFYNKLSADAAVQQYCFT